MLVDNLQHTLDLVQVSCLSGRNLLSMKLLEPSGLTKVWALTGHLEMKPLLHKELVRRGGVSKGVGLVVGFLEVFDDGS